MTKTNTKLIVDKVMYITFTLKNIIMIATCIILRYTCVKYAIILKNNGFEHK